MKVKLREKKISDGRKSLYLDFYPPIVKPDTGALTRREFLGLYIFDRPRNEPEKEHNKATKALGESIRAKRQIEVDARQFGFLDKSKKQQDFLVFFRKLADERKDSKSNYDNWLSVIIHLENFTNGSCTFGDVTENFVNGFKEFLLSNPRLSQNTASGYFAKFKYAIKQAYEAHLFSENPAARIKGIKTKETQREFLTFEELQHLAETPCDDEELKRASLFSALTGLRWSDITQLIWGEVHHSENLGYYIRFIQEKTEGAETLFITEEAFSLLGNRGKADEIIFQLPYSRTAKLPRWLAKAGITKHITFHCFRHTNATLLLTEGEELYTVSKMLGHKSIKTTEIYAKIIDKKKIAAANRIKLKI